MQSIKSVFAQNATNTATFTVTDFNTSTPVSNLEYLIEDVTTDNFGRDMTGMNYSQAYVTDANGKISATLPIGKYQIRLNNPNYGGVPDRLNFQVTETNADNLNFDLKAGQARTAIIKLMEPDPNSAPGPDSNGLLPIKQVVNVTITNQSTRETQVVQTDANGEVALEINAGIDYLISNDPIDGYNPPFSAFASLNNLSPDGSIFLINSKIGVKPNDPASEAPFPYKLIKKDAQT